MRSSLIVKAVVGCTVLLFAGAVVAATAAKVPDKVTLDACHKKKPSVLMDHKKHAVDLKIACDKCHHTSKGLKAGDSTEVKKCSSCHLTPEKADTPVCTESSPKKNPYHITCTGCHNEEAKKDPAKKGIKSCTACHAK